MLPFLISMFLISLHMAVCGAQYFDCDGKRACYQQTMNCFHDCTIDCIGIRACRSATINGGNGSVYVNCNGYYACQEIDINAKTTNLLRVNVVGDDTLDGGNIECPENKYCNITANGNYTLAEITITGLNGSKLFIRSNGYHVMESANIFFADYLSEGIIDCIGSNACEYAKINAGNGTVYLNCIGVAACHAATINAGNGTVYLNCSGDGYSSCQSIDINAKTANVLRVHGTGGFALYQLNIECPQNKYCNITANGKFALAAALVTGSIGSKLFIKANGNKVMWESDIYCPPDYLSGTKYTNDGICHISVNGEYALDSAEIYANEGLNNVRVICENAICYADSAVPVLHCGKTLDKSCMLQSQNNSDEFICDINICNAMLPTISPSLSPTLIPTTSDPTFDPTKYDPNQEPIHELYVSNTGCDFGLCNSNYFDGNIFCQLNGIESLDQYNKCCNNNPISPTPTFVSHSMDCNNTNTLTINKTGIFTYSVAAMFDTAICVVTNAETQCINPTITIRFEEIGASMWGYYLNIGYKSESNVINYEPCEDDFRRCGKFKECDVDNTLLDDIWTYAESPYVFYFMKNGQCNNCFCENPKRWVSVILTATCNPIPSTCKTVQYAFKCLYTEDICIESEYDGNGKIQMDYGYYGFNKTISIKNKQIKLVGMGMNNTIFNHTTENNTISCYFRQCYLTIESLTYKNTINN